MQLLSKCFYLQMLLLANSSDPVDSIRCSNHKWAEKLWWKPLSSEGSEYLMRTLRRIMPKDAGCNQEWDFYTLTSITDVASSWPSRSWEGEGEGGEKQTLDTHHCFQTLQSPCRFAVVIAMPWKRKNHVSTKIIWKGYRLKKCQGQN